MPELLSHAGVLRNALRMRDGRMRYILSMSLRVKWLGREMQSDVERGGAVSRDAMNPFLIGAVECGWAKALRAPH